MESSERKGKNMAQIIAVSGFKGGTGKTTLAILLGSAYAASGRRVLAIDLDHQRNMTRFHGVGVKSDQNIASAFESGELGSAITPSHMIRTDFVGGSIGILRYRSDSPETLTRLLGPVRDAYDVVILDCPPTLDGIVLNAWMAADHIVTPARLDGFDLAGVAEFGQLLAEEVPSIVNFWTVVVNFYKPPRRNQNLELDYGIEDSFANRYEKLSPVRIPATVHVHRAIHESCSLTSAMRSAAAYQAVVQVAGEVIGERVDTKGEEL